MAEEEDGKPIAEETSEAIKKSVAAKDAANGDKIAAGEAAGGIEKPIVELKSTRARKSSRAERAANGDTIAVGEAASGMEDLIVKMNSEKAKKFAAAKAAAVEDKDAATKAAGVIGQLIVKLNPYTKSHNTNTKRSTGEMEMLDGLEMEGPYAQEWTFKGQSQRVGMAARIKYRYQVRDDESKFLFWVEDYVLIGFQGTMGG
jgi:hypothetical protein